MPYATKEIMARKARERYKMKREFLLAQGRIYQATDRGRATRRKAKMKSRGMPEPTRPCPAVCECCGKPEKRLDRFGLSLVHCHVTGIFRGWLCDRCNVGIGCFGGNIQGLRSAVSYLEMCDAL